MAFGISENTTSYFLNNKIDLPRFQRKATWDERDNFKLCISVFKGYPIGVIIMNDSGAVDEKIIAIPDNFIYIDVKLAEEIRIFVS